MKFLKVKPIEGTRRREYSEYAYVSYNKDTKDPTLRQGRSFDLVQIELGKSAIYSQPIFKQGSDLGRKDKLHLEDNEHLIYTTRRSSRFSSSAVCNKVCQTINRRHDRKSVDNDSRALNTTETVDFIELVSGHLNVMDISKKRR